MSVRQPVGFPVGGFILGLILLGCSAYTVTPDGTGALVKPQHAPVAPRIAVVVPDVTKGNPEEYVFARGLIQDMYLDFLRTLEQSGLFGEVAQVSSATASADPVAVLEYENLDRKGAEDKFLVDFLATLSLFTLSPVLESAETFTVQAAIRVTTRQESRRYAASGSATLRAKTNAPRRQAVHEAALAAARSAHSKIVEQLARDRAWIRR